MRNTNRLRIICLLSVIGSAAAPAQTPVHTELVAAGLDRPVLVTAPSGDFERIFVVEQRGRIRIVRNGSVLAQPFLDLTSNFQVLFGGEAGLLGLAFHPDYANNGEFFVFHNTLPFIGAVVKRFRVSTNPDVADPTSAEVLLSVQLVFGNHNGGMLAFGPDGLLYISIGDGGSMGPPDPTNNAQRVDTFAGKVLRIDVDSTGPTTPYGIPANNPFVGPGDPLDEIWALGLRNPWRFSFDRLTGDMFLADIGGLREEVNFEPAGSQGGRNYGWSCMAGTVCENLPACTCGSAQLTLPIHEYTNSTGRAIIGGHVYRGAAIPDLRGAYFFGDYVTGQIWSFRQLAGAVAQVTNRTAELAPAAPNSIDGLSAFGEDGRGELYICDLDGEVYRIAPDFPVLTGLAPYGNGTPGCGGAHVLDAETSPVLGNPAFALRCSNGSAQAIAIMAIASSPDIAGSDPLGLGIDFHLQLPSLLAVELLVSDAAGFVHLPLPIPGVPSLAGVSLYAQTVWIWNPAACAPTPGGWSSSHALAVTLQP